MADLRRSVLELFQQGMDAVNSAVNHVTNVTRTKMDELALQNQRKELLDKLAKAVYELWQQGNELPEALKETLEQLDEVDAQLASMISKQAEAAHEDSTAAEPQKTEVPEAPIEQPSESPVPTINVEETDENDAEEPSPMPKIVIPPTEEGSAEEE